ncbi:MAG: ABC transporter substrate-binding protein [Bacillota bacterium]|jgi:branched-chain amino acid transport system substrate-binding protein
MKKEVKLGAVLVALSMLAGCFATKDMAKVREAFAMRHPGKITVGMVGPLSLMRDSTGFLNGAALAAAEVNASNSGALRITIKVLNDNANFMEGIRIAQSLAAQPELTVVVGHWNSALTIPAARIYNDAGIVMLSPVVSNPELTTKGYRYVFRNTLSDAGIGRQLARYAAGKNYRRVVIYYADNEYGMALANAFEDAFSQAGRKVIDRVTDFNNDFEFQKNLDKWRALNYDAVFVADSMPHAPEFIRQIRRADGKIPMFGGDGLDVADFPVTLGEAAEGFVVATLFNPGQNRPELRRFIAKYRKRYGGEPDVWAAQGYDSVKLLVCAASKADGASPRKIAAALHRLREWSGVMGNVSFTASGELHRKAIYQKIVRNGKFVYLSD